MFPVGDLQKPAVKRLAAEMGLQKVATKRESMGICFIGKRAFGSFMREYVEDAPGPVVELETGALLGEHRGLHAWTLGQRFPLARTPPGFTGALLARGLFVARLEPAATGTGTGARMRPTLVVAQGSNHPALFTRHLRTAAPHWIASPAPLPPTQNASAAATRLECDFRWQNRFRFHRCSVSARAEAKAEAEAEAGGLHVEIETPLRAVQRGQYAVLYRRLRDRHSDPDSAASASEPHTPLYECLGSALITDNEPSEWTLRRSNAPVEWDVDKMLTQYTRNSANASASTRTLSHRTVS